jgi:hypothetical protein
MIQIWASLHPISSNPPISSVNRPKAIALIIWWLLPVKGQKNIDFANGVQGGSWLRALPSPEQGSLFGSQVMTEYPILCMPNRKNCIHLFLVMRSRPAQQEGRRKTEE